MSLGLRALAPWARHLQIASSYLGLVVCPLHAGGRDRSALHDPTRREARLRARQPDQRDGAGSAEPTFALSIVAMVLVGGHSRLIAAFLMAVRPAAAR